MARLRRFWLNVHLWIGLGLALLLIPISISGGLLVWHDELDALVNRQRYAVSGTQVALPPAAYLTAANDALARRPERLRASILRYPEHAGSPVRAIARDAGREGGPPRMFTVYLDPPSGAVLDLVDFRSSLVGALHVFHGNLMLPQYNGRQIVGWVGVGMLMLSLTGIWLWWPRNGAVMRGLRWKRSPQVTTNLHHLLGFWISLPLVIVSATGIYLSFPQTARTAMSAVAPMSAAVPRAGEPLKDARLDADRALVLAREIEPDAQVTSLTLPAQARGGRSEAPGTQRSLWRVQMARGNGDTVVVFVDDATGSAQSAGIPLTGDRAAAWIRWIHEGSHSGPVWAVIVFLTGVFPTVFAVTGFMMWLRKRSGRIALTARMPETQLGPAE